MARKFLIGLAAAASLFSVSLATVAAASPSTYQRFAAGMGVPGSAPKRGPVPLSLRFFQEVGLQGGPLNEGNLNSGSVLESPAFATVFAYIWLPREVTISLGAFPGCREGTILNDPDACPRGAEVGRRNPGGMDPATGRDRCSVPGQPAEGRRPCLVYAAGLLRARVSADNPSVAGRYLLPSWLSLRMFNLGRGADDRALGNSLALRVTSPSSGNVLVRGVISKVGRADAGRFGAGVRHFSRKIRFVIPSGLIEPLPGFVSQLTDFRAEMKRTVRAGKALVRLDRCPRDGRVRFAYSADYNENLETGNIGLGTASPANGGFTINEVGSVTRASAPCHR